MRPAPHDVAMTTESGACAQDLSTRVNRRVFLYDCGRMLGAMLVPMLVAPSTHALAVGPLHVLVLIAEESGSARASLRRGIELGADEATHTMALFGMSLAVTVRTVKGASAAAAVERAAMRGPRRPSLLIRATGDSCLTSPRSPGVPTIDIACESYDVHAVDADTIDESPVTRAASAGARPLLHVRPSSSTLRHVQSQVIDTLPPAPNRHRRVELWHPSLERFGGEQLNQRYRRKFNEPMDSDAWAGWVAIKIAAESSLRAQTASPSALASALTDSKAQFDGHKGLPLSFNPVSGELRQPLYVVETSADSDAGAVVAEFEPGDS
jgi:hypothetical protein